MKIRIVCLLLILVIGTPAYQLLLLDDAPPDPSMPDDYPNLDDVEGILDEMGIDYDHEWNNRHRYPGITANPAFLAGYDIIFWYNDNRAIEQAEYNAMRAWVGEGNFLTVTGEDSLGSPNDPLMAALVGSTIYGDFPFCDNFTVTRPENWIMDGPAGYFDGTFDILEVASDHDLCSPKPPNTYTVALTIIGEFTIGPPKILITENPNPSGGTIVYWNGNWDAVEWWRMSQTPETVNMFKNMVNYFIDNVNVVEETSWGSIKDIFSP